MTNEWELHSPLGTDLALRRFVDTTGAHANIDYLIASLGNGSYASDQQNPLFIVQIGLVPLLSDLSVPMPVMTDYIGCLSDAVRVSSRTGKQPPRPSPLSAFNIDHDTMSPERENRATRHQSSWGITLGADITGSTASTLTGKVAGTFSYNQSEARDVFDLELSAQSYEVQRDHCTGTIWNMVFTRKDGMNNSSFRPRCDALFSCRKESLKSGTMQFLLVERLIYWGDWAEHIDMTQIESSGIGMGIAAALTVITGGLASPLLLMAAAGGAAVGAVGGVAGGASPGTPQERATHNDMLDRAMKGDLMSGVGIYGQALKAGKAHEHAALLHLDFAKGEMAVLGSTRV
ncbi:hypothetical protein [Falsiroseomonas sp. CW058]|uniref:hypothetical protein n=1 Tax=Falsiroseomonas sp. CW058 TaxID=3388664 RepID=UPI003D323B5A